MKEAARIAVASAVGPHAVESDGGQELAALVAHAERKRRAFAVTTVGLAGHTEALADERALVVARRVANSRTRGCAGRRVGDAAHASEPFLAFGGTCGDARKAASAVADSGDVSFAHRLPIMANGARLGRWERTARSARPGWAGRAAVRRTRAQQGGEEQAIRAASFKHGGKRSDDRRRVGRQ
jgi:hypothetical protein